jgi:acetyl-CoA acetyltransferase
MRHFHEFGTSREDLASVALTFRAHAGLNPTAVYREPLTREQYFAARMISSPLCLFDCDVPIDGSTAFVVSSVDCAADLRTPAVAVAGLGWAAGRRRPWAQLPDLYGATMPAAKQMWQRSGLAPDDVQVVGLYDGFSIIPLLWLEALGFCGLGESGQFIDGGRALTLHGRLPANTNGGQLSGGRLHGYGFIHEAVLQLRGQAEGRQVDGAEVAVVTNGIGPAAGCMALTTLR